MFPVSKTKTLNLSLNCLLVLSSDGWSKVSKISGNPVCWMDGSKVFETEEIEWRQNMCQRAYKEWKNVYFIYEQSDTKRVCRVDSNSRTRVLFLCEGFKNCTILFFKQHTKPFQYISHKLILRVFIIFGINFIKHSSYSRELRPF